MAEKWIYWLQELNSTHNDLVGKKCANLGEMVNLGLQVPPGFALSLKGYELFMRETGAGEEINRYVRANEGRLSKVENQIQAGHYIRNLIEEKQMPAFMQQELCAYYEKLCADFKMPDMAVAVRSSGAVSMPGQMETYLNVRGADALVKKVIQVWGSAFTTRAIAFRLEKKMPMDQAPIGIAVLKMVNAKCAGVTLTVLPTTGDTSKIVVEGNWGLGESVVSGEITPDQFIIDKQSGEMQCTINNKINRVVYQSAGTGVEPVPEELRQKPCLEEEEIAEIVRVAKNVETHFSAPQDMEWVFDQDRPFPHNLYWVQTRPAKFVKAKQDDAEYIAELMTRVFKM